MAFDEKDRHESLSSAQAPLRGRKKFNKGILETGSPPPYVFYLGTSFLPSLKLVLQLWEGWGGKKVETVEEAD